MVIHTVQPGESVQSIAQQYGVSSYRLTVENGLEFPVRLAVGQALVIQYPKVVHKVVAGDTLWRIASDYGISVNQLYRNNIELGGWDRIFPGQELVIEYADAPQGEMAVNGYAYPFIEPATLHQVLPYLTYLTPFSYSAQADGELDDIEDERLIALAKQWGVVPILHVSNLDEDERFSTDLASQLLNDPVAVRRLIEEILETLVEEGYGGVDVDFESVAAADRQKYVDFIQALADRLNPRGYTVTVALAPKLSDDQEGLLYEGIDYQGLGQAANNVLLMTYEWGYTYSEPMAVAPLNSVRQVVEYALTRIPAEKIFLGVPNYAYDWTLPYVAGQSRARALGNQQAVALAQHKGAEIMFDPIAQTPYFNYYDEGTQHEVWFEDARSIRAKLALIPEYGLQGASYWNLMRQFVQNWVLLNALYNIRQG